MALLTHSVRQSLINNEMTFALTENAMTSDVAGKEVSLPYKEIDRIELITYGGAGGKQGQMTVRARSGEKLKIRSHHYESLGSFENRSSTYAPFVRDLCQRVQAAAPNARFVKGNTAIWLLWLFVLVLVVTVAVLLALALLSGEELKGNVIGGFIAMLFAIPFSWRGLQHSKQGTFDPTNLPAGLIEL